MKKFLFAAVLAVLAAGCVEEGDYDTVLVHSDDISEGRSELSLSFGGAVDVETRSILGDGVDSKLSGGVVAVYDAATGILDSEWDVKDFSQPLGMRLPSKGKLNLYVLGNLWNIDKSGARVRPAFPKNESDVAAMVYRMDGGDVSSGRTETFAEASEHGIPLAGSVKGVSLSASPSASVELRRLFAKVTLTIDHSGLDGGISVDYFKNVDLYLRQANVKLTPFGAGSCAGEASDVVSRSDYDPSMTNGRALTYTFFVPENRHSPYPTYIEFQGKVDASAGGYGGSVCYKFHIGEGDDHDLEGNQNYKVTLGFKAGSLFEPQWSVSLGDDWTDGRKLCLAKDSAGSSKLSASSLIAVRKSRAASCWLYYSRQGSGTNEASLLTACDGSFEPSDITKSAWWCEAPGLADNGISMSVSGSQLTFRVTDASKFVSGREIPLKLHLYPGDIVTEATLTTYDDIAVTVDDGLSLSEEFYTGMSRGISVKGLAGSKVYYWNGYGVDRQALKAEASLSADWIHNSKSSSQAFPAGSGLDLYAYGVTNGQQFYLRMASDDTFNDGDYVYSGYVVVNAPRIRAATDKVYVPFDGRGVEVPCIYVDGDGDEIATERFDPTVYSHILVPEVIWSDGSEVKKWIGNDGGELYLNAYEVDGVYIGDKTRSDSGFLGAVVLGAHDTSLSCGTAHTAVYVRAPYIKSGFPTVYSEYFNTASASEITATATAYIYDGAGYTSECTGNMSDGVVLSADTQSDGKTTLTWKYSDENRIADGHAPLGPQTVSLTFTNSRTGETHSMSSSFDVYHNVTLRPFVMFTLNRSTANVIATTAKNSWIMKQYCAGVAGYSYESSFLKMSDATFNGQITMKYNKAKSSKKTEEAVYREGRAMPDKYLYQDFDKSAYGMGYTWTAARIRSFGQTGNALTYLGFCGPGPTYTELPTPLASGYLKGSQYVSLTISNTSLGYGIHP